jgi:hypothetical protein
MKPKMPPIVMLAMQIDAAVRSIMAVDLRESAGFHQ